jgi:hypothetical protein
MLRVTSLLKGMAIAIALGSSLSACAIDRSVVAIKPPSAATPAAATPAKVAAKITDIRDLRRFEVNPGNPSMPSLGDANEVQDPKFTSRAIGRKRNGYGMAMGDVMLPDNTNVASLVRDAATRALQEKGYRVVDQASPDFNVALPLAIDIEQFWAWVQLGFFEGAMNFEARTNLSGPLVDQNPAVVNATHRKMVGAAFESYWIEVVENGLVDLVEKMKARIKPAS